MEIIAHNQNEILFIHHRSKEDKNEDSSSGRLDELRQGEKPLS